MLDPANSAIGLALDPRQAHLRSRLRSREADRFVGSLPNLHGAVTPRSEFSEAGLDSPTASTAPSKNRPSLVVLLEPIRRLPPSLLGIGDAPSGTGLSACLVITIPTRAQE